MDKKINVNEVRKCQQSGDQYLHEKNGKKRLFSTSFVILAPVLCTLFLVGVANRERRRVNQFLFCIILRISNSLGALTQTLEPFSLVDVSLPRLRNKKRK